MPNTSTLHFAMSVRFSLSEKYGKVSGGSVVEVIERTLTADTVRRAVCRVK